MKFTEIVFSPTGGTQKVVSELTAEWGEPAAKVDLTDALTDFDAITLEKDAVAVIAVPSYGGRVPALAGERIAQIHGNQARCVLVCVYGNRAFEDTLIQLNDIAKYSGFKVNQRIIAGSAQFTGIAAGRGVGFTTGLLLLREGLGMRETPIRPHSWH